MKIEMGYCDRCGTELDDDIGRGIDFYLGDDVRQDANETARELEIHDFVHLCHEHLSNAFQRLLNGKQDVKAIHEWATEWRSKQPST